MLYYSILKNIVLFTQDSFPTFLLTIFIISILDISKRKLNKLDLIYLLIAVVLSIFGRFNDATIVQGIFLISDSLLAIFCIFRSINYAIHIFGSTLVSQSGKYTLKAIPILLICLLLLILSFPPVSSSTIKHTKRICNNNLVLLSGAIEMYKLDTNRGFKINGLKSFQILVENKYISSLKMCPINKVSETPYYISNKPYKVCCEVHGCLKR